MSAFATAYGRQPTAGYRSPGRVNLIGEHTDYNDGLVLPFAVPFGVSAWGAARTDRILRVASAQESGAPVEVALDDLAPGTPAGWSAYAAGMAWALGKRIELHGADLFIDGDVPAGAGLSSSAAVECAVGAVLRDLAGAAEPDGMELALLASHAENDFVGAPTGIMDQSASILCRAGHALLLDCRDRSTAQIPLDLTAQGLCILVADTQVRHQHAGGEYAARRNECQLAAETLGVSTLRDVEVDALDDAEARIVDALRPDRGDVVRRRLRHVVTENARVLRVVELLRDGDFEGVGEVLVQSHASMRDDFQISCAELDSAVESALGAGAIGARMTGGGFGGSALAMIRIEDTEAVSDAILAGARDRGLGEPRVFAVDAVDGLSAEDDS